MKKYLALFALALTAVSTMPAHARSMAPSLQARILRTQIDRNVPWANEVLPNTGSIIIHHFRREITLTLHRPRPKCLPGMACMQMIEPPVFVTLPLVSSKRNACGVYEYIAQRDERPSDGILERIIVRDNTGNTCPQNFHTPYNGDTEIAYMTVGGWNPIQTRSFFSAERLQAGGM